MPSRTLYVQIAHATPGRTRLRSYPTPLEPETAEAIAGRMAAVAGIIDVEVHRGTGSVLCRHDPALAASDLLEPLRSALPGMVVLEPGAQPPTPEPVSGRSAVARAIAQAFQAVNKDVLLATNGSLDLGTIVALGFAGTGAAEVMVKGKLPTPPWFNLAWWAFRTFITFEVVAPAAPAGGDPFTAEQRQQSGRQS